MTSLPTKLQAYHTSHLSNLNALQSDFLVLQKQNHTDRWARCPMLKRQLNSMI